MTRDGDTSDALTVNLSSSDTTEATIQSTVTIAAGQTSVGVSINAVDDSLTDGTQTVTIQATANLPEGIDTSFGSLGFAAFLDVEHVEALAVQPDGKIVAAGNTPYAIINGSLTTNTVLARFNDDGSPDTGFGNGGTATFDHWYDEVVESVVIQPDGKIVLAGWAFGNQTFSFITRLNADGTPDATFGTNGTRQIMTADSIREIVLQPDGRILAAGTGAIHRLTASGSSDTTFGTSGRLVPVVSDASAIALLSDGSILAGGTVVDQVAVAKYNSAGLLDTSFGVSGMTATGVPGVRAVDLVVRPNGRIVLAADNGEFSLANGRLIQFHSNGSLDTGFGTNGVISFGAGDPRPIASIGLVSNGELIAAGIDFRRAGYYRFSETGVLLTSDFNSAYGIRPYSMVVQQNDQFVLGSAVNRMGQLIRFSSGGVATASDTLDVTDDDLVFQRVKPLGGLASTASDASALANASDVRDFNVFLEAGETLAAVVDPAASVSLTVQLLTVSGSFTSTNAGTAVVMPPQRITTAGSYTFRVAGTGATNFDLTLYRNSAVEQQVGDTANGNELAIDDSFVPIGVGRFFVSGSSAVSVILDGELVGVDIGVFGNNPQFGTEIPLNWTFLDMQPRTLSNLIDETGTATGFNLHVTNFDQVTNGSNQSPVTNTVPIHTPSLEGVDEYFVLSPIQNEWQLTYSSLVPNSQYEIYLFSHSPGTTLSNVTITHAGNPISFSQSFSANQLIINDTIGSNQQTLDQYAKIATADATGQIRINVVPSVGNAPISGLAIRQIGGVVSPAINVDEYEIDLTGRAGKSIDVILAGYGSADFSGELLELLAPNGSTVVATGTNDPIPNGSDATNYDLGILNFVVPADGVYTVRLTSDAVGDYGVLITDSLTFDTEPNTTPADPPRDPNGNSDAIGYLDAASDAGDIFLFDFSVNETVAITTETLFDSDLATPLNSLDPELEVIYQGNTIATDLNSAADGKNAAMTFTVPQTGRYAVRVGATAGIGEYRLVTDVTAAPSLQVVIAAASISENGGSTTGTVTRSGDTSSALNVSLTSNDTTEAAVPQSVTIPAGQTTSPQFTITAVDDAIVDGTQTVTITASATSYPSASDTLDVIDDDLIDLVGTAFDVLTDHVTSAQTDVTFTVRNQGTVNAGLFDTHVVWSPNGVLGDGDDVVVAGTTKTIHGLAAGASTIRTVTVQLDKAALYAHAVAATAAGNPVGTVSAEASYLFLVVDVANSVAESDETNNAGVGHLIDSDDITYFPWDKNGNGTIEPLEALGSIQAIGAVDIASDFDGNGVVTPLEALSAIQRIGYVRNNDVVGDDPSFAFSLQSALPTPDAVPLQAAAPESAAMAAVSATPVVAVIDENASVESAVGKPPSPTLSANNFAVPDDDDENLFAIIEDQTQPVVMTAVNDITLKDVDQEFETVTDWLNSI